MEKIEKERPTKERAAMAIIDGVRQSIMWSKRKPKCFGDTCKLRSSCPVECAKYYKWCAKKIGVRSTTAHP